MRGRVSACILLCLACTPPLAEWRVQADKALASEDYEEAARLYAKVLQAAPDDKKAPAGLRRAREGVLLRRLEAARLTRITGQPGKAADAILEIVRQERDWNVVPGEAGAAVQEEEAGHAMAWVEVSADEIAGRRLFLASRHFLERYRDLFGDQEGIKRFRKVQSSLRAGGARHCETLWTAASSRSPLFADFVSRYCGVWSVDKAMTPAMVDQGLRDRVRDFEAQVSVGNLSPEEIAQLGDAVVSALRKSPFHHPEGRGPFAGAIRGGATFSRLPAADVFVQGYVEKVPYEAMETYCEWKQVPVRTIRKVQETVPVPVTTDEKVCDAAGQCKVVPVTRDMQKTVWQEREFVETKSVCEEHVRTVTRYRDVPREYRFPVVRTRQSMTVQVEIDAQILGRPFKVVHADHLEETDVAHDVNRPEIGIRPDPDDLTSRKTWLGRQFQALSASVASRLNEAWLARYCGPAPQSGLDAEAEQVFRCLRATADAPPAFVAEWFRNQFGLGVAEADSLVHFLDKK
jgi:hypothetical protein